MLQRKFESTASFCKEKNTSILCNGTLLGGLLSDRWLDKMPNSLTYSEQRHYPLLKVWGLKKAGNYQKAHRKLLVHLKDIASKHSTTVSRKNLLTFHIPPNTTSRRWLLLNFTIFRN